MLGQHWFARYLTPHVRLKTIPHSHHLNMSSFSVSIGIASIASIIPNGEDNNAHYSGLTTGKACPTDTPSKSFNNPLYSQRRETDAQLEDASKRPIVWDADIDVSKSPGYEDAEGEPDPTFGESSASFQPDVPIGIRGPDGSVQPYQPPPPKPTIVKSKRHEDRSVNFSSQTSTRLVRLVSCPFEQHDL